MALRSSSRKSSFGDNVVALCTVARTASLLLRNRGLLKTFDVAALKAPTSGV